MPLREGLGKTVVSWVWFLAGVAWAIRLNWKYGIVPKQKHLRDPNGTPYAAFWNIFSTEKWTDEGVAFHKRVALELLAFAAVWVLVAVVLGLV
jgi:hypothetical protein